MVRAKVLSECVIGDDRYQRGNVIEVDEEVFETLKKKGCLRKLPSRNQGAKTVTDPKNKESEGETSSQEEASQESEVVEPSEGESTPEESSEDSSVESQEETEE
jgi:hypothetical protein